MHASLSDATGRSGLEKGRLLVDGRCMHLSVTTHDRTKKGCLLPSLPRRASPHLTPRRATPQTSASSVLVTHPGCLSRRLLVTPAACESRRLAASLSSRVTGHLLVSHTGRLTLFTQKKLSSHRRSSLHRRLSSQLPSDEQVEQSLLCVETVLGLLEGKVRGRLMEGSRKVDGGFEEG